MVFSSNSEEKQDTKVTNQFQYKLDYVLIPDDIISQKYSSGTFKNLYSEHKSLFLRICFDENEVLKTPNLKENIENMPNIDD